MRKLLTGALAAATTVAAVAAVATPAQAERYRYGHRDNNNDAAVVGGIVGLALGAAIAGSNKDRRYDDGYYRQGYYDNGYGRGGYGYRDNGYYRGYSGGAYAYDYGPRVCISRERVYDPRYGRRMTVERRYAC